MSAADCRAHVRQLLREREPALAARLAVAAELPCGPGCRAVPDHMPVAADTPPAIRDRFGWHLMTEEIVT